MIQICFHLGRLALGTLLGVTGVVHFSNPYLFAGDLLGYGIVDGPVAFLAAAIVMSTSIVIGGSLLANFLVEGALAISASLFLIFVGAQLVALLGNGTTSCGCFGGASSSIGWVSIGLAGVCAGVSTVLLVASRRAHFNRPTELQEE